VSIPSADTSAAAVLVTKEMEHSVKISMNVNLPFTTVFVEALGAVSTLKDLLCAYVTI
jgi:hypothetical protein